MVSSVTQTLQVLFHLNVLLHLFSLHNHLFIHFSLCPLSGQMLYKKLVWNARKNYFSRNNVIFNISSWQAGPCGIIMVSLASQLICLIIFIVCLGPFDGWWLKQDYKVDYICFWTHEKHNLPFPDALILTLFSIHWIHGYFFFLLKCTYCSISRMNHIPLLPQNTK